MSRPSLDALRRQLLAELPGGAIDPARIPEFAEAFNASVIEVADTAGVILGTVSLTEWHASVMRLIRGLTGAVTTAAEMTGVGDHSWIAEAQRWAVHAAFDRIAEVSRAAPAGGRA